MQINVFKNAVKMRIKKRPKFRKRITASCRMSDRACVSLLAFTTDVWSTAGNLGPLLLLCSDF